MLRCWRIHASVSQSLPPFIPASRHPHCRVLISHCRCAGLESSRHNYVLLLLVRPSACNGVAIWCSRPFVMNCIAPRSESWFPLTQVSFCKCVDYLKVGSCSCLASAVLAGPHHPSSALHGLEFFSVLQTPASPLHQSCSPPRCTPPSPLPLRLSPPFFLALYSI